MPAHLATVPMSAHSVERMSLQIGDARLSAMTGPTSMYSGSSVCFAEPDGYNALHGWSFAQD